MEKDVALEQREILWSKSLTRLLNEAATSGIPSATVEALLRDHIAVADVRRRKHAENILGKQTELKRLLDAGIEP